MLTKVHSLGRTVIQLGFLTLATGEGIIAYSLSQRFTGPVTFNTVQGFTIWWSLPVAFGISAVAWWWLTTTVATDRSVTNGHRRGVRLIGVQFLVLAAGQFAIGDIGSDRRFGLEELGYFVAACGGVLLFLGFFKLASELRPLISAPVINQRPGQASVVLVIGYLLITAGASTFTGTIANVAPSSLDRQQFEGWLYFWSVPWSYLLAALGWWLLARLFETSSSRTLPRARGLQVLSLQSLILALGMIAVANVGRDHATSMQDNGLFIEAAGGVVATLGFWMLALRVARSNPMVPSSADLVPNVLDAKRD